MAVVNLYGITMVVERHVTSVLMYGLDVEAQQLLDLLLEPRNRMIHRIKNHQQSLATSESQDFISDVRVQLRVLVTPVPTLCAHTANFAFAPICSSS